MNIKVAAFTVREKSSNSSVKALSKECIQFRYNMEKQAWNNLQHRHHTVSGQSHGVGPPSARQRNAIRMVLPRRADGGPLSDVLLKN